MTGIVVKKLVWDEWNTEHIKKHKVAQEEVEEAVKRLVAHKRGYKERFVLIGRSGKRIISTIVKREKHGVYYVITARDSDKKERRIVYGKEKKKQNS